MKKEIIKAEMITSGLSQSERIVKLNTTAQTIINYKNEIK